MSLLTLIVLSSLMIPTAMAAIPGTYFWKPRLGLDLSVPTTTETALEVVFRPNMVNIRKGLVVMVYGWNAGMTFVAYMYGLVEGYHHSKTLNPISAYFYTNVWRWWLRYLNHIPDWMAKGKHIADTTKLWHNRFRFQGNFVPEPLRYIVPYVKQEEWDKEMREYTLLKKSALFTMGYFNRYPRKKILNDTHMLDMFIPIDSSIIASGAGDADGVPADSSVSSSGLTSSYDTAMGKLNKTEKIKHAYIRRHTTTPKPKR